ncbi:branched-chain amino acid ABC transporter permease [Roseibacterium sp. SDUM158016]|uniref:branched-chain amino acid ABC transporter permease n=1 Tax=Roseicyclus sediminis TaxID=2980997 RepID=UPI0021D354C5|nr:branched-chain amino acid ABC transporter permease [Roseibacterium sp. SDUM158016]MCU4652112.1 branched-chain amino acid ABC transporter permease [Roseibacterium sp. SDUM158016]
MLAQQILNGVVSGSIYALFALGFTLLFGVQKLLNLAHGAVFMAGAFIAYYCVIIGLPFWVGLVFAMIASGVISIIVELVAFRQIRKQVDPEFPAIVSSLGVDLILINIAQNLSNTRVLSMPFGTFPIEFYNIFGLRISLLQIVILVLVAALVGALVYYLQKTSFGRQVRAVAQNERAAALLGVSAASVYRQTFFIAGALAGVAGVLIGLSFNSIHFLMGEPYLLYAFVVVVIGGIGSVPGAVVAAILLGVTQALTKAYLSSTLSDAIIFSLLFVALLFFPNGLFGRAVLSAGGDRK